MKIFRYILDNGYAGKEYFEMKGINFEKIYQSIEKYIKDNEKHIKVRSIFDKYMESLSGISDVNLKFYLENIEGKVITNSNRYFSEKGK